MKLAWLIALLIVSGAITIFVDGRETRVARVLFVPVGYILLATACMLLIGLGLTSPY